MRPKTPHNPEAITQEFPITEPLDLEERYQEALQLIATACDLGIVVRKDWLDAAREILSRGGRGERGR